MNARLTRRSGFAVSFGRARSTAVAIVLATAGMAAGQASAAYTVDQQQPLNDNGSGGGYVGSANFGQSFIPTASTVQWGEFVLRRTYFDSSDTAPLQVSLSILNGAVGTDGLRGDVLATSPTFTVTSQNFVPVDFQFDTPVTVTPGQRYVLAVNVLTNVSFQWQQANNDYANGQMVQSSLSSTFVSDQDYVFREGTGVVPEPATLATLAVAGLGLTTRRRRR